MFRPYTLSKFLCFFVIFAASDGVAGQEMDVLTAGGASRVVSVVDGDTVVLDDGRQVRLVGIQAPKLPLGRKGFKKWPLADRAKKVLEDLSLGGTVELRYGGARVDRHGRVLAHLYLADGLWLQGEMLRLGLARVYTFPDNRKAAAEMYALESAARRQGRGIWGHSFYAVLSPPETMKHLNEFQVVEGKVLNAAKVKGRVYLNFGADWRKDFTITIYGKALKMFQKTSLDPVFFKGKTVRVRGWLEFYNGPLIEASHPEQIEVLPSR